MRSYAHVARCRHRKHADPPRRLRRRGAGRALALPDPLGRDRRRAGRADRRLLQPQRDELRRHRRGRRLLGGAAARQPVRADDRALPGGRVPDGRPRRQERGCRSGSTTRSRSAPTASSTRSPPTTASARPAWSVDFGTGINIDAVSADGEYLGGAIGPGLEIVAERPDRPRRADHADRPRRTADGDRPLDPSSDQLGLHLRLRGPDRRHRRSHRSRTAESARCSPPAATPAAIVPFCETIDEVDDLLTLKGLRLIHERNAS